MPKSAVVDTCTNVVAGFEIVVGLVGKEERLKNDLEFLLDMGNNATTVWWSLKQPTKQTTKTKHTILQWQYILVCLLETTGRFIETPEHPSLECRTSDTKASERQVNNIVGELEMISLLPLLQGNHVELLASVSICSLLQP
jgi:hypothetical protein